MVVKVLPLVAKENHVQSAGFGLGVFDGDKFLGFSRKFEFRDELVMAYWQLGVGVPIDVVVNTDYSGGRIAECSEVVETISDLDRKYARRARRIRR